MAIGLPVVSENSTSDVDAAVAAAHNLRLCGFSVSERAGTTATVQIMHGATVAAGTLGVATINCAANGFGMWMSLGPGIPFPNGISINRVSGTTDVLLYVDRV